MPLHCSLWMSSHHRLLCTSYLTFHSMYCFSTQVLDIASRFSHTHLNCCFSQLMKFYPGEVVIEPSCRSWTLLVSLVSRTIQKEGHGASQKSSMHMNTPPSSHPCHSILLPYSTNNPVIDREGKYVSCLCVRHYLSEVPVVIIYLGCMLPRHVLLKLS
jgi:hypothetical protein